MKGLHDRSHRLPFDHPLHGVVAEPMTRKNGESAPSTAGFEPPIDVWEVPDAFRVRVELPGVAPDDVTIDLEDGDLTIRGEKHRDPAMSEAGAWSESRSGPFRRVIRLDRCVDPAAATADLVDGVLHAVVPKVESARPRRIAIGSAARDGAQTPRPPERADAPHADGTR